MSYPSYAPLTILLSSNLMHLKTRPQESGLMNNSQGTLSLYLTRSSCPSSSLRHAPHSMSHILCKHTHTHTYTHNIHFCINITLSLTLPPSLSLTHTLGGAPPDGVVRGAAHHVVASVLETRYPTTVAVQRPNKLARRRSPDLGKFIQAHVVAGHTKTHSTGSIKCG